MDIIDERYTRGKIYKIVCNETGEVYYGSTIRKYISDRIAHHRCEKKCESKHIINRNNYYYELVEVYSCNNVYELETREKWYMLNNKCINKNIPLRTYKEWYKDRTEEQKEKRKIYKKLYDEKNKEKSKKYYEDNKTLINGKAKEKMTCGICGSSVRKSDIARHRRTKFCLSKIDSKNPI